MNHLRMGIIILELFVVPVAVVWAINYVLICIGFGQYQLPANAVTYCAAFVLMGDFRRLFLIINELILYSERRAAAEKYSKLADSILDPTQQKSKTINGEDGDDNNGDTTPDSGSDKQS